MQPLGGRTKGQLEAAVSQAVIRFEREYMGRGPLDTRTYLLDDIALVRLRGVLTPTEQRLAASPERGGQLVRQMRQELHEQGKAILEKVVGDVLGVAVRGTYTDLDILADERVLVFALAQRPPSSDRVGARNEKS